MMASVNNIDIKESALRRTGKLLNILLIDRTSKKNILWATDSYKKYGTSYTPEKHIEPSLVTGIYGRLIQPRASKSLAEQHQRTKDKAEVFTSLKIVDQMNKEIDNSSGSQILNESNWKNYVRQVKLEITCGEAPFIVSRYNPTANTRKLIKLDNRVGFLDRKLQIVSKFCHKKEDWLKWAEEAFKSSYGYEWQGDNVLIARENLLYSLIDYYKAKFSGHPTLSVQEEFAKIISWNIFQMDGLKYVVPLSCYQQSRVKPGVNGLFWNIPESRELFDCEGCRGNLTFKHNGMYVNIMDWEAKRPILFVDLIRSSQFRPHRLVTKISKNMSFGIVSSKE